MGKNLICPRCVRIIIYEGEKAAPYHCYLDLNEVEMITAPLDGLPMHRVFMKSGKELSTNEDCFNLIERAMRERK
jgi:hypothetical protein